jgi:TonB family protein
MRMPRSARAFVLGSVFVSCCFLTTAARVQAQLADGGTNSDTARAIATYQQGNFPVAVKRLLAIVEKRPDDADAWYSLGLAINSQGFIGNSWRAFEECVRLRPDSPYSNSKLAFALVFADQPKKALATAQRALELGDHSPESHYAIAEASLRMGDNLKAVEESEIALRIDPNFKFALITRSLAHYHLKQYSEAAASMEQFLAVSADDPDVESWRGQLEEFRQLVYSGSSPSPIFTPKEVTTKAQVLSKPVPQYPEAARIAGVRGMVALRAVLSDKGEVKHIVILRALGYGLTTQTINAARQIRFTPAIKDGQPVSMSILLEYNFNLY